MPRSVVRYYLGVVATETGQAEGALSHWQTAQAEGFDSRPLQENLQALAYKQAITAWQGGQPERAAELLKQVQPGRAIGGPLKGFEQQLDWEQVMLRPRKGSGRRPGLPEGQTSPGGG